VKRFILVPRVIPLFLGFDRIVRSIASTMSASQSASFTLEEQEHSAPSHSLRVPKM